jgi:hypothetical protein
MCDIRSGARPPTGVARVQRPHALLFSLKRVAFERIHATRFKFLLLCMSLSQPLRTLGKPEGMLLRDLY